MLLMPFGPKACRLPCTRRDGTPPQVPSDAHDASKVVDWTLVERAAAAATQGSAVHDVRRVQSESEVPEVCAVIACCYPCTLRHMVVCGLVQVSAAASRSATDLPPHATRPERQHPSNAWLDTTVPVDSKQFDETSTAASLAAALVRSRGAPTMSVAAAEP